MYIEKMSFNKWPKNCMNTTYDKNGSQLIPHTNSTPVHTRVDQLNPNGREGFTNSSPPGVNTWPTHSQSSAKCYQLIPSYSLVPGPPRSGLPRMHGWDGSRMGLHQLMTILYAIGLYLICFKVRPTGSDYSKFAECNKNIFIIRNNIFYLKKYYNMYTY